jgi:molybdopterin converting factor subunit 1
MRITVRCFAAAREIVGGATLPLDLPDQATVGDAWAQLGDRYPSLKGFDLRGLAVNRDYVEPDHRLSEGDELAVIPPVSGG